MYRPGRASASLVGVEAVIDKDLASELLARELDADLLVMATDVDGVYADWGTPRSARAGAGSPPTSSRHWTCRPGRWARRSRRRADLRVALATRPSSGHSLTSLTSSLVMREPG